MFGKKKENPDDLTKVLKTYTEQAKTIQKWLNGKRKGEYNLDYEVTPIDITEERYINLDLIRLDIFGKANPPYVTLHIPEGCETEYIKSWKKGLGRFINKDIRKKQTEGKYFILSFTDTDLIRKHAFIRIFTKEELEDKEQYQEFERYKLLNITFPTQILSGVTDTDVVLIQENSVACILKIYRDGTGLADPTPLNRMETVFLDEWNNPILPLDSKEKTAPGTVQEKEQPIPMESLF